MKFAELREEIEIESKRMEIVVQEIIKLDEDTSHTEATHREKTAASAYLAQFYNGVENTLKRLCRFYEVPLPTSSTWHIDLFRRFCSPPKEPLPVLFGDTLITDMAGLRKFRHVVHHGYGFQLDWDRLVEGMKKIESVFGRYKSVLLVELSKMEDENKA
ncbi:MAG: hypothetical protein MAG431_00520 [Chloroflexi bacterium]|nr:hypothetical protein [Chloroflexota bacterium]